MPELPEVETIARTLTPLITNQVVSGVSLLNECTLEGPLPLDLLTGRRILGAHRRGKLLLIDLEEQDGAEVRGLAIHLRMTGRLFVFPAGTPPGPHTRAILDFMEGGRLFFDDARKFGRLRVFSPESDKSWAFWNALGPEPLLISGKGFARLFTGRKAAIKSLLLDQSVIAGVGNIYADESLFRAGIAPFAPADQLSEKRLLRLHKCLKEVLLASIEACGSSIRDYRTARGDAGAFQNSFQVYGRGGQPCLACGTTLQSRRVAGRTTVWCPRCQGRRQCRSH
ncbi:MAG: bifunctional DNA-formamidopyrimidine glycosylase/DNA-(apurinic or apyrimidinic site) lyase [Desulfovibrionaceae bacterium]|nr:bifunctional DNA-formamidopyrimidine glycosylase/DNA-(apurinic or apyrimidinic site) lyase [Desulfovibrionaceae bacterium]